MQGFQIICFVYLLHWTRSSASLDEDSDTCEALGPWSRILEDWATGYSHRQMRIMKLAPTQDYYLVERKDPNRYYEWPQMTPPPPPSPGKIVNRPPISYLNKEKPGPEMPKPQNIIQESQRPQSLQELQRPQSLLESQRPQNIQGSQRPQSLQEIQRPQSLLESQRPHNIQESQRPESLQAIQRPQSMQETQRPHYIQESQRPQSLQEIQQAQASQDDPRPYGMHEKPNKNFQDKQKPYGSQYLEKPSRIDQVPEPQRKEVSETDLYLLGAIEKLVYRVDFMEKRIRKLEESMYQMLAGTHKNPDPCPFNYTRAGSNCYYFGHEDKYDWKTANLVCRKLKGNLIEMENVEENKAVTAHVMADAKLKGKDFWTGGLNPGLLFIWSNSARPVNNGTQDSNASQASYIHGEGRCLKLSYNPALRNYKYLGTDCSLRQNYICELPEKALSNEIERLAKKINLSYDTVTSIRVGNTVLDDFLLGVGAENGSQKIPQ